MRPFPNLKVKDPSSLFKQPFDVKKHAANFINYCEVIIWPDGKIEYAVPSHNEIVIKAYCKTHNVSRDSAMLFFNSSIDSFEDAIKDMGIIQIWYEYMVNYTKLTSAQHKSLSMLLQYDCVSAKIFECMKTF